MDKPCLLLPLLVFLLKEVISTDILTNLQTLSDSVIGIKYMQDYLDNEVQIESTPVDGSKLVKKLSASLSDKFTSRAALVEKLRSSAEQNFPSYTTTTGGYDYCCAVRLTTEFNYQFKGQVDMNDMCIRESSLAGNNKRYATSSLLAAFKSNHQSVQELKWQYFGTEEGVLFSYPSSVAGNCGSYDPRFRPWYVETVSPVPKDIVIIVDQSGSMRGSLIHTAKEAAKTVLGTLNSKDRVNVVAFSNLAHVLIKGEKYSCLSTSLAMASSEVKRELSNYIDSLKADGGTYYVQALSTAFALLENTPPDPNFPSRNKALLFLTDGDPSETKNTILATLDDLTEKQNHSVSIFTFGIGRITDAGTNILAAMSNRKHADNKPGHFTRLVNTKTLRSEMASYYTYFSKIRTEPVISVPYFDAFGLGMVVTVSLPVYISDKLIGVAGIDISLTDLMEDAAFLTQGGDSLSYAFVIDNLQQTMVHPLVPQPQDVKEDPVFVDIAHLEHDDSVADIIASMKRGGSGKKTVLVSRVRPLGENFRGVQGFKEKIEYSWAGVNGTKFSVGVAMTSGGLVHRMLNMRPDKNTPFLYHQLNISGVSETQTCKQFIRTAVKHMTGVKFSASAFKHSFDYLDRLDTETDVQTYKAIINDGATSDMFADQVLEGIQMTAKVHDVWFGTGAWAKNKYVIWRYIATPAGVLRVNPAITITKTYDATKRSWYRQAVANPYQITVSTPYLDAFGAGYVITVGKALFYDGHHGDLSYFAGVIAVDLSMGYFYQLLQQDDTKCSTAGDYCFLMDAQGYVVMHKDYLVVSNGKAPIHDNLHVTNKEHEVATFLMDSGYLYRKSCFDYGNAEQAYSFRMNPNRVDQTDIRGGAFLYMDTVYGTNLYKGLRRGSQQGTIPCFCQSHQQTPETCKDPTKTCECPCYTDANYQVCSNTFDIDDNNPEPCIPKDVSIEVYGQVKYEYEMQEKSSSIEKCYDSQCQERNTEGQCYEGMGCSWCVKSKNDAALGSPYCAEQSKCYFGQEGFPDPYSEVFDFIKTDGEGNDGGSIALPAGVGGGIALLGIIVIVVLCQKTCRKSSPQGGSTGVGHVNHAHNDDIQMEGGATFPSASGGVIQPTAPTHVDPPPAYGASVGPYAPSYPPTQVDPFYPVQQPPPYTDHKQPIF